MQDPWDGYRIALQEELHRSLDGVAFSHGELLREQLAAVASTDYELAALVCLRFADALGAESGAALPAASALALIAQMGLVFDGLESRHGSPSLSTAWGMPRTLNAGDAFFAVAQSRLLRDSILGAEQRLLGVATLDGAIRAYLDAANAASDAEPAALAGQRALLPAAASLGGLFAGVEGERLERLASLARSWSSLPSQELALRLAGDITSMLDGNDNLEHAN